MKKVLSLLVAYCFLQTEMWALSGGPIFDNAASTALTGVYAGTFVQKTITAAPGFPINPLAPPSLGTFTLQCPVSGQVTGFTVIFQGNVAYSGTITGAANPGNRTINGIIQATSTQQFVAIPAIPAIPAVTVIVVLPPLFIPTPVTTPGTPAQAAVTTALFATGRMNAKVSGRRGIPNSGNQAVDGVQRPTNGTVGGVDAAGNPISLGSIGDRLSGKAVINAQFLNTAVAGPTFTANRANYSISGIRQTNVPAVGATP